MSQATEERSRAPRRRPRRRPSLLPRSLRWRLAAWVTVVIAISFAITFVAVYRGTGSAVAHQIDREITGDAGSFSEALLGAHAGSAAALAAAAEQYVRGQPFGDSSKLLFALTPRARTATNQPELLDANSRPDEGESIAEQQQENRAALRLRTGPIGFSTVNLPDVGQLRLLRSALRVPLATGDRDRGTGDAGDRGGGVVTVTVGVGEPLAAVAHAQAGVARAFILAGILVLAGALVGAYLIGTRFSSPLRRMAGVAARVDGGDLHPRIHDVGDQAEEIRVLADSFNHMLDRLTDAFAGQRAFVADASHELRTPLTVIRGQLELLLEQPDPPPAELHRVGAILQAETARIARLVDDLLLLAKSERSELLRPRSLDLESYVLELWEATSVLADRRFELAELAPGTLLADPDRLAQALRNLLSNAIELTAAPSGLVRLSVVASPAAGTVRFIVDDDGPGIPADQRELVFDRFHRTDLARARSAGGAGLGLAIVRAIAQAHGGWVRADVAPAGGARIELELPGFTPGPPEVGAEGPAGVPAAARGVGV